MIQSQLLFVMTASLLTAIGCSRSDRILDERRLELLANSRFGSMRAQVPQGQSVELGKADAQALFRSLASCELLERAGQGNPALEVFYQAGADPIVFEFYLTKDVEFRADGHWYYLVEIEEFFEWLDSLPADLRSKPAD